MTANDRFFQELQPAAVLKHSVLAEYCTVFTSMIGRRFPGPIWLIDGYAGPGFYTSTEPGGQPIAGSPVVAMRIAAKWKGTRDLRCVFIEADPRYAAELASNVQPYEQSGLVPIVLAGPVQDRLRDAWEHVAGSPVVTFLDPFGVAMPTNPMTDLLLAKGRPRPSEVLLNINLEAVGRLDGWLEERGGSVVPKPGMRRASNGSTPSSAIHGGGRSSTEPARTARVDPPPPQRSWSRSTENEQRGRPDVCRCRSRSVVGQAIRHCST